MIPTPKRQNRPRFSVVRAMLYFAAGYVLITAISLSHHCHRDQIERIETLTALGDQHFFKLQPGLDLERPLFFYEAHNWFLRDLDIHQFPDLSMRRVGHSPGGFALYRQAEKMDSGDFYLKTFEGQFFKVEREKPPFPESPSGG